MNFNISATKFEEEANTFRTDLQRFLIDSSKKGISSEAILTVLIEAVKITEFMFREDPQVTEEYVKQFYSYADQMVAKHTEGKK